MLAQENVAHYLSPGGVSDSHQKDSDPDFTPRLLALRQFLFVAGLQLPFYLLWKALLPLIATASLFVGVRKGLLFMRNERELCYTTLKE